MKDINEILYNGKPDLDWINSYIKEDGTVVEGHWRTSANETSSDNLSSDNDEDGIPGWLDSDADGDGILEAIDNDGDGIADAIVSIFDM